MIMDKSDGNGVLGERHIWETPLGSDICDSGSISYSHELLYSNSSRSTMTNMAELRNKLQIRRGGELMGVERVAQAGI
jgi:hypothetical protein